MGGFASLSFPSCVQKQDFIVLPSGLQGGLTEGTRAQPSSEGLEMQGIVWPLYASVRPRRKYLDTRVACDTLPVWGRGRGDWDEGGGAREARQPMLLQSYWDCWLLWVRLPLWGQ